MTLTVSLPPGATCDRATLATGFKALYEANHARLPCTFSIERQDGQTTFLVTCPPELRALIEAQVYAAAPAARVEVAGEDYQVFAQGSSVTLCLRPRLGKPGRAAAELEGDRLRMLLAVMDRLPREARAELSLKIRPATRHERLRDAAIARRADRLASTFSPDVARLYLLRRARARFPERLVIDAGAAVLSRLALRRSRTGRASGEDLTELPLFSASITITLSRESIGSTDRVLAELAGAGSLLGFGAVLGPSRARSRERGTRTRRSGLLTPDELSDFWHLPAADAETAGVAPSTSRELEPPAWLPKPDDMPDVSVLGEAVFRNRARPCGLGIADRMRHLVVVGKTGTGKSTLLEQLITSDVARQYGVGVIDPHGQLVEAVVDRIPRHRTNDVVLFDAADTAYPIGFNPLRCRRPEDRSLVAAGVLAAFKKLYPDFFGPRMEHIFRNALLACVAVPGLTLVHLQRLLCDRRIGAKSSAVATIRSSGSSG